jgi:acyl dehydratase
MLVMGLAGQALEAWFPGRKLTRWDAKFVSFVLPGERLYVRGERTPLYGDSPACGINGTWMVIDGKNRTKLSGRFAFK